MVQPPDDSRERAAARIEAVTLQFHPDWPYRGGKVIESMAAHGLYRSQFSTGISNGGLTAFPGGDRWRWESRLFVGRYDDGPTSARPVYGAWNRRADPYGGGIRFGSSYVRLRPEAMTRATFCFPDSAFEPADVGDLDVLPHLCRLADASGADDLDECVEAHVHGPHIVDLARSLGNELTPSVVGTAARARTHPPQQIKQVWPCLARFGRTR
ncbi:uncharacterized protein DUF3626 [Kribbella antiqua]|uniref:Uncharacterized protein DUF3626 n=1 Tax=Kribbella antiqua TaxID=2512217 RepID=A0A4R2J418_9ACTN|nr:DUF3626 domain-containing protein [Kribbella antiqua]TCO51099.1 uncharacterized protein DUF3626 [Kribbella antiqua]